MRLREGILTLQVVVCVVWVGTCTGCVGTDSHGYINGLNIESFRGCTQVDGSLIINHSSLEGDAETNTPPITSSQLSHLSDIKEITGYLLIENVNFTNLRFLRNLEVLHGVQTIEYRSGQHYALIIEGNDNLQTLSLSSLQRIENGGIRISGNPQLCLVDTLAVDEFLVSSTLRRIGGLGMDCSAYTCHEQCAPSKGCWGTLADECVECRNYNYLGTCMESCDTNISYANATSRQCIPLAPPTVEPTESQSITLLHSSTYNLTATTAAEMNVNESDATIPLHNDPTTNTTSPDPPTTSMSDFRENLTPDWTFAVGAMSVVAVLILLLCIVGCLSHKWKKSQSKTLTKKKLKDETGVESHDDGDCDHNSLLRVRVSHSGSSHSSETNLPKQKISISELNSLSGGHSQHAFAKGQSSYHSDPGVTPAHVSESCDYHPDHVTLQYADVTSHFHSSNSVDTHNNIRIDFPNHTSYQSLPPDLPSAKCTTPILAPDSSGSHFTSNETEQHSPVINHESTMDASRRVSNNSSSSHFTSRERQRQSQASVMHRPMTGAVYSTRMSPSFGNNPHRSSITSSHGTRTPSHHTPSHLSYRGSLTSSHGETISRASTMTSRTSNYQSNGGSTVYSGRTTVSDHGSDSSLAGLMEQNGQPYSSYEEPYT